MNKNKREEILKRSGFVFERLARHGEFWSDGITRVLVPRQTKTIDPRSVRNWIKTIERAKLKRSEISLIGN